MIAFYQLLKNNVFDWVTQNEDEYFDQAQGGQIYKVKNSLLNQILLAATFFHHLNSNCGYEAQIVNKKGQHE